MSTREYLSEIAFIRPLLIVLLVMYHAFIIYMGGWQEPSGFIPCKGYEWIARFSYSFMLETFVFISGYLFAFQRLKKNESFGGGL